MKITIEHKLSQDRQKSEILLREYEFTQTAFYEMEKNVWQTASVFVVLSVGGVSILITNSQHNWANFLAIFGIGIVSILILWIWYGVIQRWWSVQNVHVYRMEEIEAQVGMWKARYIDYLDATRIFKWARHPTNQQEAETLSKLDRVISHYSTIRIQKRIRVLVSLLILSWVVLIIRELMLSMSPEAWNAIYVLFGLK